MQLLIFSLIVIIVILVIYLVYSRKQTKQTKKRRSTLSVPRNIFNIGRNASAELRREVFDRARNQYMNVLTELIPHEAVTENNIGFIIDNAAEFAFEGGRLMNDVLLTHIIDIPLANMAEQRRDDIIQERQTLAKEIVAEHGRGAGVEAYIDLAIQNTDDPQNAHDVGVLACLRAIVARLRADQSGETLPNLETISAEMRIRGDNRIGKVEAVIDQAKENEYVIALGATDAECLSRVWLRTSDPRNSHVIDHMRQAVYDALFDCWEEGIIVCVNGRTSRILAALTLLDWDKRNWEVKKFEQFKNDIFTRTGEVITNEAELASISDDPDMQRAGRLYLATTLAETLSIGEVPEPVINKLTDRMRNAIDRMVDSYVRELEKNYEIKDAIPHYMIDNIIKEAKAAI